MHRDGGDPLGTRLVLGYNTLLLKVVLENLDVSCCEEMGLCWMETNRLDYTFRLSERPSRVRP